MRLKFLLVLLAFTAMASVLLFGPVVLSPEPQSAEATNLSEIKKLLASDAQAGDFFGYSVALSGDTAIVGAQYEGAGGGSAGAAYVFQRDEGGAGNWGQVKKLTASDAQVGTLFGWSVAVTGDTAVVGAIYEDAGGGSSAGAAYVFQRDEGGADSWGQVKKLTTSDAEFDELFGFSVAVSGGTAVVGAPSEDAGVSNAGAAYVFQRDQGGADNWGEVKKLTASDAEAEDFFGISVAVSNDTAVVGAWFEDAGGSYAGAAYVFRRDEGGADNWGEVKKLAASDGQTKDYFGIRVAVSADTAVVGASGADAGGSSAGAAYMFQRDEGGTDNWGEVKKLTASAAQTDAEFGFGLAISGDTAVAGAAGEDAGGSDAGAAYVFDLLQPKPTATSTPTITPTPTNTPTPTKQPFKGDTDGDGCADVNENLPKAQVANGGGRDYMNPWDWYDVNQDGIIDMFTDILGVINHYSLDGSPPYDPIYDRGASAGPNPWNMTAPDGVIDLFTDILGVIQQHGHDCT